MSNLFLFTGEHTPALEDKLRFWQQQFVQKHSDANLEVYENVRQDQIPQLISVLETQPFLADKRMVVLHGLPQSGEAKKKLETEALESVLADIPESTIVVFVSPKPDKRLRFYKILLKHAQVESFELPKGKALVEWAQTRFKHYGKSIDTTGLNTLVMYCAEDVQRMQQEIEKLSLLDTEQLTSEHVQRYVSATPEAKIFQALDQLGKSDQQGLLREFERLISSGEDLMMMFFMIVRQFRLLLQTRDLLDKNASPGIIQKRLKLAPFQASMLIKQAKFFRLEQLKNAYQMLAEMDYKMKTGAVPSPQQYPEILSAHIDQFLCSLYE